MAKTNFSKSEVALDEMLQKMTREKLLELADSAQGNPTSSLSDVDKILQILQLELRYLFRVHREIYKNLNLDKKWLKKTIESEVEIPEEEWKKILELKKTVDEAIKKLPSSASNEKLIEEERKKHINKRFNVNDKWLPLR